MLPNLHVLLLSHNRLSAYEDLEHLKDCKALQSLDLQQNSIDDIRVLDLFKQIPDLRVLYLQGNPVTKKIKYYRKTITAALPTLKYLDDRPIFPEDRLRAEAFTKGLAEGGVKAAQAAERAEIKRQREEKKAKEERNFRQFEEMLRNARLEREAKKAEEERKKAEAAASTTDLPTTETAVGTEGAVTMATAIETAQKGEINPFSGEKVIPTKENEVLTKARRLVWQAADDVRQHHRRPIRPRHLYRRRALTSRRHFHQHRMWTKLVLVEKWLWYFWRRWWWWLHQLRTGIERGRVRGNVDSVRREVGIVRSNSKPAKAAKPAVEKQVWRTPLKKRKWKN